MILLIPLYSATATPPAQGWPTKYSVIASGIIPPVDPPPPPPPSSWTFGAGRHATPPAQIFHPNCYLNAALPNGVLIDSITPSVQTELVSEAALGAKPALQSLKWSMPVYTVPSTQPRVPVKFHTQPPPNYNKAQQQILVDPGVPIPAEHVNQGDSDDEAVMIELDATGVAIRAHEFWRLRAITPVAFSFLMPDGTTWSGTVAWECSNYWQITTLATHLGRSRNHNAGTYPNAPVTSAGRLDSENTNMSVAATRIPFVGTNLTLEDVTRGLDGFGALTGVEPDHCLNLSVVYPNTAHRWPASTDDGFSTTSPIEEGMRLRFDPTVYTVAHINAMSVHPLCRLCIWIITRRGIVVVDKSGSLEIDAEPKVHDYYNGTAPSAILNGFPWGDLQVLVVGSDAIPNPTS